MVYFFVGNSMANMYMSIDIVYWFRGSVVLRFSLPVYVLKLKMPFIGFYTN